MIEPQRLISWARELAEFANAGFAPPLESLFTREDVDLDDYERHRLPQESRTTEEEAALRKRARAALQELSKWQPSKSRGVPSKLVRMAADWLEDPAVRSTHEAHSLTPMDGVLSLSDKGQLQVVPRFRTLDAQFAVTFAELIQDDARALVRRCTTCQRFFIYVGGSRGQPRKLCDQHHEESKHTKKRTKK